MANILLDGELIDENAVRQQLMACDKPELITALLNCYRAMMTNK